MSISELLGNQAPTKRHTSYIIPPANLNAEELLAERQRFFHLEECIPQPNAGERRSLPVSPLFTRPPLFGIRLNTARRRRDSGHDRFPSGGRLMQSKFPQWISSEEQNNVKLLVSEPFDESLPQYLPAMQKRESDALQNWIDAQSFSDEDRTFPERHRSTICNPHGYSSRSNSNFSSSSSRRSARASSRRGSESWASNTGTVQLDPIVDDAASETSKSSVSSRGSSCESDLHSDSNPSTHGRRLSPPPQRGHRLMRMQQHQLSFDTRSPGFLRTVMNAVTNLWLLA